MESSEALMLRKNDYGEADYMIAFFTRDFGKIRGIAKNAKKSGKRFGGRLEPFVHLSVRFRERQGGIKFIEDSSIIRAFSSLMEDIELFIWGSFVLENFDVLLPDEEPNEKIFDLGIETFRDLDLKKNPLAVILKFQLSVLEHSGYKPNFDCCASCGTAIDGNSSFSFRKGGVYCRSCKGDISDGFISRDVLFEQDYGEDGMKALDHIKTLAKFTEYHSGKEIKSTKFLEEIMR